MKAELVEKFECKGCCQIHDSLYEAENCCEPEKVFMCSVCEETFPDWDEDDANDHLLIHEFILPRELEKQCEELYHDTYLQQLLEGVAPLLAEDVASRAVHQYENQVFRDEIKAEAQRAMAK